MAILVLGIYDAITYEPISIYGNSNSVDMNKAWSEKVDDDIWKQKEDV